MVCSYEFNKNTELANDTKGTKSTDYTHQIGDIQLKNNHTPMQELYGVHICSYIYSHLQVIVQVVVCIKRHVLSVYFIYFLPLMLVNTLDILTTEPLN